MAGNKETKNKEDQAEPTYGMVKAGRDFLSSGDYGLDETVAWNVVAHPDGQMTVEFVVRTKGETATICQRRWSRSSKPEEAQVFVDEVTEKLDTLMRHCAQAKAALKAAQKEALRIWNDRFLNNID